MRTRTNRWNHRLAAAVTLGCVVGVGMGACGGGGDDQRRGGGVLPTTGGGHGVGGGSGGSDESCEADSRRECKVQIDANNCFVGEQACLEGEWGPCVDPEKLDTAALGMQSNCASNPCNPWCQTYGEDPAPDLEAAGTAAPAGGPISGLPSSWQAAGQVEPCSLASDCQFDTYCDTNSGSPTFEECVPWGFNTFDPAVTTAPDLTVPVQCDNSFVTICNRAAYAVPAGTDVEVAVLDASTTDYGTCTPTDTVKSTCVWSGGIGAGKCVNVSGCSFTGTSNIYVNTPDPPGTSAPGAITEAASAPGSACGNNWSVYHPASQCACSAGSASSSLSQVTMYLVLDDSGSMKYSPPTPDLWSSATSALTSFVQSAAADNIRFAMRTFKQPNGACESMCDVAACTTPALTAAPDNAPNFLSDAAYEASVVNFITTQNSAHGTPHIPTIQGMANWGTAWKATHPTDTVALVYITDGQDGDCGFNVGDDPVPVAAPAGVAFGQGVLFYTVALPNANLSLMNEVASQGGTTQAINLTTSMSVNADVTAALTSIQQSLFSCDIPIPNAGQVDTSTMTVEYLLNGVTSNPVVPVPNVGMCSGSAPPYQYYLSAADTITLCPETCDDIRLDTAGEVNFLGGCIGGYTSFQTQQMYQGDCGMFTGAGATWEFLTFDTDTPGDSEVIFELRTGNTAAEAMASPWIEVARTTSTNPDASFGGMNAIDLNNALGPLAQQEFVELQITINPTSNQQATPTVYDWDLQFSCLNNQ